MSVTGKASADGTVQILCPECGVELRIKPKSDHSNVTCAQCAFRFVLDVVKSEPATSKSKSSEDPNEFEFAIGNTPDDRTHPATQTRSTNENRSPSNNPSDRSTHYKSNQKSSSTRTVVVVSGAIGGVLLFGVGLMAALGVFKSESTQPGASNKDKTVAATGTTTNTRNQIPTKQKAKGETTNSNPTVSVSPKINTPDPSTPETNPDPELVPEPPKTKPKPKVVVPKVPDDPEADLEQKLKEVLARVKKATPLVEGKGGAGSGFVVRPGILVTNSHVIEREVLDDIKVRFVTLTDTDPKPIKPVLLYEDRIRDLAILRIDSTQSPLELCDSATELEGLRVAVVGNPTQAIGALKIGEVTFGSLNAPARLDDGQIFYQLDAPAAPGNSGGPVIDQKTGKVVGVLTAGVRGRKTTWCIPYSDVAKALSRLPAADKEAAGAKHAAALHYVQMLSVQLPEIEENAAMAMDLQRLNLRGEEALFRKGDKIYTLPEVMKMLKEEHGKTYQTLNKLVQTHVATLTQLPERYRQVVRARLDACNHMRLLADSKPMTEAAFVKLMEQRKLSSENAVKVFDAEVKKYQDQLETKYNTPPK